jgi:hypothetical protein
MPGKNKIEIHVPFLGVEEIIKRESHHNNRVNENARDHVVEIPREKNCYYTKIDKSITGVIMDKEKYRMN